MKIETKCLHEGYKPENGGPGVMPIVQSTTYRFDSTAKIASLFDMPTECIYSRFANPTCDAVEKKIASLEGGVGAMLTSSGQAASLLSILNLCSAGDSFIAASTIYGDQPVRRNAQKAGYRVHLGGRRGKRGGSAEAVQAQHQGCVR